MRNSLGKKAYGGHCSPILYRYRLLLMLEKEQRLPAALSIILGLLLFRPCLCPITVHSFFHIARLVFAWAAISACSSCLHSAVLPVSITKLLLIPNSAFQGSGAAAEISSHNLWYPLITSQCTNSIAWGFCILSLLTYQEQRSWGYHVVVTAVVAANSFWLHIRQCTEADG